MRCRVRFFIRSPRAGVLRGAVPCRDGDRLRSAVRAALNEANHTSRRTSTAWNGRSDDSEPLAPPTDSEGYRRDGYPITSLGRSPARTDPASGPPPRETPGVSRSDHDGSTLKSRRRPDRRPAIRSRSVAPRDTVPRAQATRRPGPSIVPAPREHGSEMPESTSRVAWPPSGPIPSRRWASWHTSRASAPWAWPSSSVGWRA